MRWTLVVLMVAAAACGQVSFGSDRLPVDAAPVPDLGVDVGVPENPDTGDPVQTGCRPVTLPPATVEANWPFNADPTTYEAIFLTWARELRQNCTGCHSLAANRGPPLIIADDEVGQLEASRTAVWQVIATSEPKASVRPLSGPLWRHVPDGHDDPERSVIYSSEQIQFLEELIYQAWACKLPAHLASQDAGAACGPPTDTGMSISDGGPDAGQLDVGAQTLPECYCDAPDAGPADLQYCVP